MSDNPYDDMMPAFLGLQRTKAGPVTKEDVAAQQASDSYGADSSLGHLSDVISGAVSHVVPDTAGFLADVLNNPVIQGLTGNISGLKRSVENIHGVQDLIPGGGQAARSIQSAADKILPNPRPQTETENWAEKVFRGAADMAPFALGEPAMAGRLLASGVTGAVGGELAHRTYPDSYIAPVIGNIVGGALPFGVPMAGGQKFSLADQPEDVNAIVRITMGAGEGTHGKDLNPDGSVITSPVGARGQMQVMPDTAKAPGHGIKPSDGSLEDDARVGRQLITALFDKYKGDPAKAWAAYNWGEGNVDNAIKTGGDNWLTQGRGLKGQPVPHETLAYVDRTTKALGDYFDTGQVYAGGQAVRPMNPDDIARIMGDNGGRPVDGDIAMSDGELSGNNVMPDEAARINTVLSPEEQFPTENNVVDMTARRQATVQGENDPLIADNIAFANRIHQGIDQGVITERHIPNIEDARNNILNILEEFKGRFSPEQEQAMKTNVGILDEALQRLGAPVDNVALRNTVDNVVGNGDTPPAANDAQELPLRENNIQDVANPLATKSAVQRVKDAATPPRKTDTGHDSMDGDLPTPAEKFTESLKQAVDVRPSQDRLLHHTRQERTAQMEQIPDEVTGQARSNAMLSALKGDMGQVDFEPIAGRFTNSERDVLEQQIHDHPSLNIYDKINAVNGMRKLMDGVIPGPNELFQLQKVFPKIIDPRTNKGLYDKVMEGAVSAINVPRTLMTSFDLSAPYRQGVFFIGRKEFYQNFGRMYKAAVSEQSFNDAMAEIRQRGNYNRYRKGGLSLTDKEGPLADREEGFMTDLAQKIPGIGVGVKASERAYVIFLNRLRADTFDSIIDKWKDLGVNVNDPKRLRDLGKFINAATGRGSLGKYNDAAPLLSAAFFSPRLQMSRMMLMNPVFYARLDPMVRKEALKSLFSFVGIMGSVLGLASLAGAKVAFDTRSSDALKIRVADTRFDILGGFAQYIHLATEILRNSKIDGHGQVVKFGKGFKPETRTDTFIHFVEGKLSPAVGTLFDMGRGTDQVGNKLDASYYAKKFVPLLAQDMFEAYKEYGAPGLLIGIPSNFGIGVQTYKEKPHDKGGSTGHNPYAEMFGGSGNPYASMYGNSKTQEFPQ